MTYTSAELATELSELDYPTTKRRLTDWVQKGLLPSPRARGRGQGRGKEYRWEEADILHRAIDVAELLDWHRRAADLFLPLWVLGYDVPLPKARSGLEGFVQRVEGAIEAAIPYRGERSDLVSDLLWNVEAQLEKQRNVIPLSLVTSFLHAFIDPGTRDWTLLLEDVQKELARRELDGTAWPNAAGATTATSFVRDQLSAARLRELVAHASDDDLARVQEDLRTVMHWARAVASVAMDIEDWVLLRILVSAGKWGALIDLALRQSGHGELVDRSIRQFTDTCHQLLTDPRLRVELHQIRTGHGAPAASAKEHNHVTDIT
jgi:hypothetical protein